MSTKNFYESINELVTDSRFRSLAVSQNFENFMSGNGIHEAENMQTFSWLLQPRGSHGLQDVFLKELLASAWTTIHGQYLENLKSYKTSRFYTGLSPVMFQQTSFYNAFIDRDCMKTFSAADIVITDVDSKILVVVNNHYSADCKVAYEHFNSDEYRHFEFKLFLTFDPEVRSGMDSGWMYMKNEWIINLCADLIEAPQYSSLKMVGYLNDFYQFLTGAQYGTNHSKITDYSASLVSDFYETIREFRTIKAEKVPAVCLIDINPREYASKYMGKISEKEYELLSLYWAYKNTFSTFFDLTDLESVTRDLEKTVANKSYRFDRTFIRNGFLFTPSFDKVKSDRTFMNRIFDVEMVLDMNKNLSLGLVINKASWDRLSVQQRETIQKDFKFTAGLLKDRVIVMDSYYKQNWKNKDLCKEIVSLFDKVDSYLAFIGIRAA